MKKFFAGYLVHSGLISLYQDYLGKEAYIQKVTSNWMDANITVPLAIACILTAIILLIPSGKPKNVTPVILVLKKDGSWEIKPDDTQKR